MTTYVPPKKNGADGWIGYVSLLPRTPSGIFQASPTLASGDVKIAIDDGAPANLATLPAVDADYTKRVKIVLSQAETNGDNLTIIFSDAAGAEWCDLTINLQTVARQVDDLTYPNTSGRGMDVDASGGVEVGSFQAGAITAAAIANGAIDAATFAADVDAEILSYIVDDATRIDASALNTATGTTIPAILDDTDLIDDGTSGLAKIATDVAAILVDTSTTLQGELDGIQADTEDIQSKIGTPSDLGGGATVAANLADIEAQTDDIGVAGAGLTAINLPNQTMDIVGNITGNLSGSVGSVTGDVGGNVTGSIGSLATQAKADVNGEVDTALADYDGPTHAELTTALGTADDAVLAALATTDGKVDDIKTKTDSLTFTVANQVDSNVKSVTDITITGAGTAGDPWGP